MPISVMTPVIWVVRISALESLVISAFCKPMMKHSSITVSGTNRPVICANAAPRKPKHNSNSGFEQQRQGVLAVQLPPPRVVDHHRRTRGAKQKRQHRTKTTPDQLMDSQREVVGHGRDDAGHMRGVLLHGQKAASINRTGDKRQGET